MPPYPERAACQPGKLVKIGVDFAKADATAIGYTGERFWVKITGKGVIVEKDGKQITRYHASVSNDLFWTQAHGLKHGDFIEFGPENILQLDEPPPGAKPPTMGSHRPLMINDELRTRAAQVVEYAKKHRYNMSEVLRLMKHPEDAPGHNPEFVVVFPFGYRCVYTEEEQPGGWMRHISISLMEKETLPPVQAVEELIKVFGFRGPLKQCNALEIMKEKYDSVNVWEFLKP